MTEAKDPEAQDSSSRFPFETLKDFNAYRSKQVGLMMENNHRIQMFLRYQVENWEGVAEAYKEQYEQALNMIEATAVAIRVAADSTAKLIETEYGLQEIDPEDFSEDDDDED